MNEFHIIGVIMDTNNDDLYKIRINNKHELQNELNQFDDYTIMETNICCTLCTCELIVDIINCSAAINVFKASLLNLIIM